ncbi:MAG: FecR domain-containing protein [Spirochaetia bacterium]|nr:FecR domain-containing protein [Spirochaetia bacterium]
MKPSVHILRVSIAFVLMLLLQSGAIFALDAQLVYREGRVDIDRRGGDRIPAYIGDDLRGGDSVITGMDGFAELEQRNAGTITVEPDTIFTIDSEVSSGRERDVLRCTLGSISYRFDRIAGDREPRITTPSAAAGIRGTELTVAAGEDGSSLFVVQSGRVDVEAQGKTVSLGPEEGVEVRPGEQPGEKFDVKRGQIDYSSWRQERRDAFIDDPVASAKGLERRFDGFVSQINSLAPLLAEQRRALERERENLEKIGDEKGQEAQTEYYRGIVQPIEDNTFKSYITLRYYAQSAFSIRRFVLGHMYLSLKTAYLEDLSNHSYQQFIKIHNNILQKFATEVLPHLTDADLM